MRRTKIICTIGPKTADLESLQKLAEGGMNVARLNMSHGTHEWHANIIDIVQKLNTEHGFNIAIMIDTKGPEIRSGDVLKPIELQEGDTLTLTIKKEAEYPPNTVLVNYDGFINDVEVGDTILVDSGLMDLEVTAKEDKNIICKVLDSGTLTSRRHLNIRGKSAQLPPITDKDWEDIDFGISKNVDYFALSFVNDAPVVRELKTYLQKQNSSIKVISKMESTDAVNNMHAIIDASDAVMVARGDLGAELPIEDVPMVQQDIVDSCRLAGKPVIVATQLLESMMLNPTPTRAEVTDIFYAVSSEADAIMMSGETANGNHPFKALEVMSTVATKAEENVFATPHSLTDVKDTIKSEIVLGGTVISNNINADAMVVFSNTGDTAQIAAQCRPLAPIFVFVPTEILKRQMSLVWGCYADVVKFNDTDPEQSIQEALSKLQSENKIKSNHKVVLVSNLMTSDNKAVHAVQVREIR